MGVEANRILRKRSPFYFQEIRFENKQPSDVREIKTDRLGKEWLGMDWKGTVDREEVQGQPRRFWRGFFFLVLLLGGLQVEASENVPRMPFAMWAELPKKGELRVTPFYQESEAYHMWVKSKYHNVTWKKPDGERYGIDITQGFIALDYGLADRWALDLNIGYTTVGWRYFTNYGPQGKSQSTSGLMDTGFGVRYLVWDEERDFRGKPKLWGRPRLVFRAGAVVPGSFKKDFPFAPGTRSAAIEPGIFVRKHFWDTGFGQLGMYLDTAFRWNRTTANDQWLLGIGFFCQIKGWELDVGYRRLHSTSGDDLKLYPNHFIYYPRGVREIYDAVEAGFSYTTPKRRIRYGFWTRTVLDGSNTDAKFWLGGYVSVPFQIRR